MPIARTLSAAVALAVTLTALGGCAKEPEDTTCGDYLKKSEQDKWSLIKELAKKDGEPVEETERGEFVLLMDGICEVHHDKTIKDAVASLGDLGGPGTAPPAAP